MTYKKIIVMVSCVMVILIGLFYFPHLWYAAFKFNFLDKPSIGGVTLNMSEGWFPVVTSDTKLGRLLLASPSVPTIAYAHVRGGVPGADLWVVFAAPDLPFKKEADWKSKNVLTTNEYSWGTAYIIKPEVINATSPNYAVFEGYNLTATSPDSSSLSKSLSGIISLTN